MPRYFSFSFMVHLVNSLIQVSTFLGTGQRARTTFLIRPLPRDLPADLPCPPQAAPLPSLPFLLSPMDRAPLLHPCATSMLTLQGLVSISTLAQEPSLVILLGFPWLSATRYAAVPRHAEHTFSVPTPCVPYIPPLVSEISICSCLVILPNNYDSSF
jgi:hypothetical protein